MSVALPSGLAVNLGHHAGGAAASGPRVLHVGKYYPPVPGGMERVLQLLCEHGRGVRNEVLVAGVGPRTIREHWNGVPVTRAARLATIGSVGVCPTLPFELRRVRRDITVIHEPNPMALGADLVARQEGPLVVWYHSEVLRAAWKYRLLYEPLLQRVLRRAARIIVSSPRLAEHAQALRPYAVKCQVVPFGIDLDRLAASDAVLARATAIRARYRGPLVLFVGRLVPYKGVSVLLDAVAGLDVTTVIAGDGPLSAALRAQASRLPLPRRVVFTGEIDETELLALYHACDMFVLPSVTRAEAFGMVQLEAMGCGKPVISTDLPSGVPWVNQHGESGLVVPPGDAAALRGAIETLACDDALRARLGTGARLRVEREFTAARMAERTLSLYASILDERGRAEDSLVA
jgi:glycosyltransferase involved in cell wall biosynthesis